MVAGDDEWLQLNGLKHRGYGCYRRGERRGLGEGMSLLNYHIQFQYVSSV